MEATLTQGDSPMTTPRFAAERIVTTHRSSTQPVKVAVRVTTTGVAGGWRQWNMGGKRAERAEAVLVTCTMVQGGMRDGEHIEVGCRQTLAAAQAEAARHAARPTFADGSGLVVEYPWAVAVPVQGA